MLLLYNPAPLLTPTRPPLASPRDGCPLGLGLHLRQVIGDLCSGRPGEYRVYVGGEFVPFKVPEEPADWEHVCFGWESATGILEFWMNGKPWPRKSLKQGYTVSNAAFILLGQEQDHYGGSFDPYNSFSGEITDVYMWDFLLSPYKMRSAHQDLQLPLCSLGWKNLQYEIKGDMVVKARLR
ncbi:hypothetical protein lerEdw1_007349 [Lerista edwardsae]|nr:hypothetical protein lerEdw1_007349 [Lerista edwardsae]